MKNKERTTFNYILKEVGIEISPMLESLFKNPKKLESLNNIALEQVVKEFVPIYRRFALVLDGPRESMPITTFIIFLMCKLNNKPELQKLLNDSLNKKTE